jgi:hypothetical protein
MSTALILPALIVPGAIIVLRRTWGPEVPRRWVSDTDPDAPRVAHDLAAIRTRFEQTPSWPSAGVAGERR